MKYIHTLEVLINLYYFNDYNLYFIKNDKKTLEALLKKRWNSGKVLIVLGPRQVGKTTLLETICKEEGNYLFFNRDDIDTQTTLENIGEVRLRQLIGSHHTVFFDEAQRIHNIGLTLKIIHDQIKNVRVVV